MTKDELIAELERIDREGGDEEVDHGDADRALLKYIDDERVTAAFDAIGKWYA